MRRINAIHNPARHCVRAYVLFVAIVLFGLLGPGAGRLKAQVNDPLSDLGVPPFSTNFPVENGWIGMANGNLHLEIPVASYPQRGRSPITIALAYDSTVWPQCSICIAGPTAGWRLNNPAVPMGGNNDILPGPKCTKDGIDEWDTYKHFFWMDSQGTTHQFGFTTVWGNANSACGNFGYKSIPSADDFAQDLSGYHMYVTNFVNAVVYRPDGTIELPNINGSATNAPDANGNYVSGPSCQVVAIFTVCNVTDTLGRSLFSTSVNGNTVSFTVLNSQGTTTAYTATLQTINYHTNFSAIDPTWQDRSGTMQVIQSIGLPDGTNYQFGYDSGHNDWPLWTIDIRYLAHWGPDHIYLCEFCGFGVRLLRRM